jgi:molybdate ABC transporter permease protein
MEFDLSPLWISLKTSICATIISFFLGIFLAKLMFSYRSQYKGIIDGILTLPIVLPPTVLGLLLLLLLGKNSLIGKILQHFNITIIFSWSATVIASTVVAFPLMYKTVLSAFKQVNPNLIDCARTLGASENQIFMQILLPLALPGVFAGTVLAFARALGEFGATLMLAGSIAGQTQTMPIAIFFAAESGRMDIALLWVGILVSIAVAAIFIIECYSDFQRLTENQIIVNLISFIHRWILIITRQLKFAQLLNLPSQRKRFQSQPLLNPSNFTQLSVNIQNNLSNFILNIKFDTDTKSLGILGASGSGKSMTLRCIAGLETPHQGQIILNNKILFDDEKKINIPAYQRRIGFVFQNYALFPHMRVAHNIGFGLQYLSKEERKERVYYYLELMQLKGLEKHYPHQLSGGQQQRVALARALAINPEILLLDEPLSALDNYLRDQIEQLLIEVLSNYQGITLFVTHKLEEAYRVCDQILVIYQGKKIALGRKEDIFEHPPNYTVAQLTECKNISRIKIINSQTIEALDWGCSLEIIEPISPEFTYIGIRAHHLTFPETSQDKNTFPCWLVKKSETQHRVTLFLSLDIGSNASDHYHLQAEVYKEKWQHLKTRSFPWLVHLAPSHLMLMKT